MNNTKSFRRGGHAVTMLVFALVAALSVMVSAVAHASPHRDGGGYRHMERTADRLNLSDEQRQQMKQIHREARPQMMSLRDAMQDNREALRKLDPAAGDYSQRVESLATEKAELIRQMILHKGRVRSSVYAILTPEQRKLKKEQKKRWHKAGGERRSCARQSH